MQVSGAQPVGSRGLSGVSVAVSDPQSSPKGFAAPADARATGPRVVLALTAEPVVFPREGLPVDQRPTQLRLLRAASRYKESEEFAPRPPGRHAQGRKAS